MVENSYISNHNLSQTQVVDLLVTGFTECSILGEKNLTEQSRNEIKNAVKKDEEGTPIFDEHLGLVLDAVNTLLFTIIEHFIGTPSNVTSVNLEEESSHVSPPSVFSDVEVNPNQRLSSVLLNKFNYLPWEKGCYISSRGRSKLDYVNAAIQMPESLLQVTMLGYAKDQLVMSWLLNSMERKIAKIFSYVESFKHLWKNLKEMYGNQNNSACVFQLKREISGLQQEIQSFVQHLGKLTTMWNELNVYRPHTIDVAVLMKRAEEDKIFQLLASLSSEFEDLQSHILMNPDLPSFSNICATIQREEVRKKVMKMEAKPSKHARS